MRLLSLVLIPPLLALGTLTACADAVTYKGVLGTHPIVVELTQASDGPIVGRYSYLDKGGDIPLLEQSASAGAIVLAEEQPCTQQTCTPNYGSDQGPAPIGAIWTLAPGADGAALSGTWQATGKSRSLPVDLHRIGARPLNLDGAPPGTSNLIDFTEALGYGSSGPIAADTSPYEFAKLQVPLTASPVQTLDGSRFQYLTDPRTGFEFPRIISLADGSDPAAANAYLQQRHLVLRLNALDCLGSAYQGFGWSGVPGFDLGGYDEETIVVTYLSPTVMSWTESGSLSCGGAHPYNHDNGYNLDVKAGADMYPERVFSGWQPVAYGEDTPAHIDAATARADPDSYYFRPGQTILDYFIANRAVDAGADQGCDIDALIPTSLGVHFVSGDLAAFTLEGLPHAVFACGGDPLLVPLADIKPMLTPEAATLFPALAR